MSGCGSISYETAISLYQSNMEKALAIEASTKATLQPYQIVNARAMLFGSKSSVDGVARAYICEKTYSRVTLERLGMRCERIPKYGGQFADGSRGVLVHDYANMDEGDLYNLKGIVNEIYDRPVTDEIVMNYTDGEGDDIALKSLHDWRYFMVDTERRVETLNFALVGGKAKDAWNKGISSSCHTALPLAQGIMPEATETVAPTPTTIAKSAPAVVTQQPVTTEVVTNQRSMGTVTQVEETMSKDEIKVFIRQQMITIIPVIKAQVRAEIMSEMVVKAAETSSRKPIARSRKSSLTGPPPKKSLPVVVVVAEATKKAKPTHKKEKRGSGMTKKSSKQLALEVNDYAQFWLKCNRCDAPNEGSVKIIFAKRNEFEAICDKCYTSADTAKSVVISFPLTNREADAPKPKRMSNMFETLMSGYASALTHGAASAAVKPTRPKRATKSSIAINLRTAWNTSSAAPRVEVEPKSARLMRVQREVEKKKKEDTSPEEKRAAAFKSVTSSSLNSKTSLLKTAADTEALKAVKQSARLMSEQLQKLAADQQLAVAAHQKAAVEQFAVAQQQKFDAKLQNVRKQLEAKEDKIGEPQLVDVGDAHGAMLTGNESSSAVGAKSPTPNAPLFGRPVSKDAREEMQRANMTKSLKFSVAQSAPIGEVQSKIDVEQKVENKTMDPHTQRIIDFITKHDNIPTITPANSEEAKLAEESTEAIVEVGKKTMHQRIIEYNSSQCEEMPLLSWAIPANSVLVNSEETTEEEEHEVRTTSDSFELVDDDSDISNMSAPETDSFVDDDEEHDFEEYDEKVLNDEKEDNMAWSMHTAVEGDEENSAADATTIDTTTFFEDLAADRLTNEQIESHPNGKLLCAMRAIVETETKEYWNNVAQRKCKQNVHWKGPPLQPLGDSQSDHRFCNMISSRLTLDKVIERLRDGTTLTEEEEETLIVDVRSEADKMSPKRGMNVAMAEIVKRRDDATLAQTFDDRFFDDVVAFRLTDVEIRAHPAGAQIIAQREKVHTSFAQFVVHSEAQNCRSVVRPADEGQIALSEYDRDAAVLNYVRLIANLRIAACGVADDTTMHKAAVHKAEDELEALQKAFMDKTKLKIAQRVVVVEETAASDGVEKMIESFKWCPPQKTNPHQFLVGDKASGNSRGWVPMSTQTSGKQSEEPIMEKYSVAHTQLMSMGFKDTYLNEYFLKLHQGDANLAIEALLEAAVPEMAKEH